MQPLSGNLRPDLLPHVSLVLRLPSAMHLSRSSSNFPCLRWLLKLLQNPPVLLTFDKVHNPLRLPRKTTSERPKVLCTPQLFFSLLASTCASRHNGLHFFDMSTCKSGPMLVRFVHFDLDMCFTHRRFAAGIFGHEPSRMTNISQKLHLYTQHPDGDLKIFSKFGSS